MAGETDQAAVDFFEVKNADSVAYGRMGAELEYLLHGTAHRHHRGQYHASRIRGTREPTTMEVMIPSLGGHIYQDEELSNAQEKMGLKPSNH